jgi:hypothetical protein
VIVDQQLAGNEMVRKALSLLAAIAGDTKIEGC